MLPWQGTDAQLLEWMASGHPQATRALYDRFADDIHRLVWHVLGADTDHDDIVQQSFAQVLQGVGKVRESERLGSWVASVVVNTARNELRRRRFRRAFGLGGTARPPEYTHVDDHEARDLVRRIYSLLDRFPVDERIAFVLRHVEGRKLGEVAQTCGCSLATINRRLARAQARFKRLAGNDEALAERLKRGEVMS